jgi:threonine dehydrogenase-like Zn-dependent dehydrogenase
MPAGRPGRSVRILHTVAAMRALSVAPGTPNSGDLTSLPEPEPGPGDVLVQGLAVGVCGTDREIIAAEYGEAPPGESRLVLGHESLGRVVQAPEGSGLGPGDLVVGIVRRPDPVPCPNCAVGEWDMCLNGRYTEHGIKGLHGFCRERYALDAGAVVKVPPSLGDAGVLAEPASVLAKAWEHVEAIGRRARWEPRRLLVTGAGPIGLLAALLGVQRGLEVDVFDRHTEGPKPGLVKDLGARYHVGRVEDACKGADVVMECTGVGALVLDAMRCTGANGIVCLTGLSSGGRRLAVDVASLNKAMVLENDVVFGTVNANRRHYEAGLAALQQADPAWLGRLITRRVPLDEWPLALEKQPEDVKTVIALAR